MPYTSATELKEAKRRHKVDFDAPASARGASEVAASPAPAGRSYGQLSSQIKLCQTNLSTTPRRAAGDSRKPLAVQTNGHDHEAMEGPPYHASAREFAQEKKEHMTPIMPSRHADPSMQTPMSKASEISERCSSYEKYTQSKRHHEHLVDSCHPHSSHHKDDCGGHCTSGIKFNDKKRRHSHQVDECREASPPVGYSSQRRSSNVAIIEEKKHHRFDREPIQHQSLEVSDVIDEDHPCNSVRTLAKAKRRHSHTLTKPPLEEPEVKVQRSAHESYKELTRRKMYHVMDMNTEVKKGAEESLESPKWSQKKMEKEKRLNRLGMLAEDQQQQGEKPARCVSNYEYTYGKARHRHEKDSCRQRSQTAAPAASMSTATVSSTVCKSNKQLQADKVMCRFDIDGQSSARRMGSGASEAHGSQCRSYSQFESQKRNHRHEIDSCTPRRDRGQDGGSCDPACTSVSRFTRRKMSCGHTMDECRTGKRTFPAKWS